MNLKRNLITAVVLTVVALTAGGSVYVYTAPTPAVAVADAAEQAKIVIKALDKAKVGQLVVLDVSESNANSFNWKVLAGGDNFLVIDNGRRAVFSSGVSGKFIFVVAAAKGDTIDVITHTIEITGGVAQVDSLVTKIASWCDKVESPTKRDDLLKLSQSFASVSAVITPSMTPAEIVEATKKSTHAALGENIGKWLPFLEGLQGELKARDVAGTLPDSDAHAKAWLEIADGLKQYAESN